MDSGDIVMDESAIWQDLGAEGINRLVAAFYRQVRLDDVLGPMYPQDDWEGAEHRLASFLRFRLGAETAYLEERGHPRLRMRHLPFRIGEAERDRWLELMDKALAECEIAPETREPLLAFFAQVADFMRNQ